MAEQERRTKAERREEKREKRAAEEAAAKAAAAKAARRNATALIGLVAIVGGLIYLAVGYNQGPEINADTVTLTRAEAEEARAAAGCEVLDVVEIAGRDHLAPAEAPPAEALYPNGRPTASGPHFDNAGPVYEGVVDNPLDERSTTHNMEHGSVLVWIAEDTLESDTIAEIDSWVISLNERGFEDPARPGAGSGVIASMYGDPGIDSGKAIAFRAWGVGMDCDSWDQTVANAFVLDNYGTAGNAPERDFAPFPPGIIAYVDEDGATEQPTVSVTDAPSDSPSETASESATDAPSETASETATDAPSETASETATDAPSETASESDG